MPDQYGNPTEWEIAQGYLPPMPALGAPGGNPPAAGPPPPPPAIGPVQAGPPAQPQPSGPPPAPNTPAHQQAEQLRQQAINQGSVQPSVWRQILAAGTAFTLGRRNPGAASAFNSLILGTDPRVRANEKLLGDIKTAEQGEQAERQQEQIDAMNRYHTAIAGNTQTLRDIQAERAKQGELDRVTAEGGRPSVPVPPMPAMPAMPQPVQVVPPMPKAPGTFVPPPPTGTMPPPPVVVGGGGPPMSPDVLRANTAPVTAASEPSAEGFYPRTVAGQQFQVPTIEKKAELEATAKREATGVQVSEELAKAAGMDELAGQTVSQPVFASITKAAQGKPDQWEVKTEADDKGNVTVFRVNKNTGEVEAGKTLKGIGKSKTDPFQLPQTPGGTNAQDLHGDDYLKTIPGIAATVKAIAEGRRAPYTGRAAVTGAGGQIMNAVMQYDPDFSEQRAQIRRAFTAGPDGKNIGSLNTAAVHLDQYADALTAMKNGQFVPGNRAYNYFSTMFGGAPPTNASALGAAVAGEMATSLKGVATDAEIRQMHDTLSSAASPEQGLGVVNTNLHILKAKLGTYQERYRQQIPNDTVYSPILPSARAVFDKHGIGDGQGGGNSASSKYAEIRVGPNNHQIGYNATAKQWEDVASGQPLK